tara:strand:+ start:56 stop:304 length:249 start_codon:yes stop_codon:yes gene_type:complete
MNIKRLSIPVDASQHQAIKVAAMLHCQTIKDYILDKVFDDAKLPNKETLKAMREIEEEKNLTTYTVDAFLEELRALNDDSKC